MIADMGSVRPGRADAHGRAARHGDGRRSRCTTLAGAKHSGQFGGAAPDALIVAAARARVAARRQRRRRRRRAAARGVDGRVLQRRRVPRARRGAARAAAASAPAGSARASGRARRSRSPASTCRRSTSALNAVVAARAREDQPARASRAGRRRGAGRAGPPPRERCGRSASRSRSTPGETGNGFSARHLRPGLRGRARGDGERPGAAPPVIAAGGGSIPLVSALQRGRARRPRSCWSAPPTATPTSTRPNERVLLDEFEQAIVAEAEFFGEYAGAERIVSDDGARRRPASAAHTFMRADARRDRARSATRCPTRRSCSSGSASA